jgi:hypothetical protein
MPALSSIVAGLLALGTVLVLHGAGVHLGLEGVIGVGLICGVLGAVSTR